ncbi:Mak10 subunit, NatC N-terminal acetyltransferase-domain-containing protein [Alternaria rosae]|uniref:Mak10 subunit, NatC N-terminal acetyltransferase-domain-containing protein n=1 Tax=Alternaria rosae TaxID=1187941 RepID=UPI001E8D6E17|nr:Mak10 subunit, NatC N-terminal acetyltransferase-domain-containing protein [Alternaria rosae]KAH6868851.1 Mak10 subunit, NatC N-terminal acetyltransferase-domain-containing protein [Alternaria rosae]
MADASSSHSTAPTPDHDTGLAVDGAGPSHAQESAPTISASTSANLPLRQSRHPVAGTQPKIHDVTEKFTRACSALEVGQLVKDEYFTLFESIGAIEIMDPKMDSGFLQPGETLEDDYDTLAPLLPEELIGIMDQLLCYEMAWHTGYPLSQTLFTSLYIDKLLWPETKILEHAQFYRGEILHERRPGPLLEVLRAYCLALIKGCDFVIAKITGRDYFEEEDFCTHTYNRVLFVSVPMDVFLRELDAAMETIEDPDFEINDALRKAISSRLELRKDFLRALDLDLPLDQISYSWPPILQGIDSLKNTHQLGKTVPGAFSPKMQRRLASTVPPRPVVELDFKDALEKLHQIATDCAEATRFPALPQDPLEYQSFLWHFSARSPPPLTYARSYLATLLFHPDVLNASVSLPLVDVKTLVLPSSPVIDPINWTLSPPRNALMPKPPRLQFAMLIDEFVDRAGQAYLDLWVAMGQNRCRLRRMLTHVITGWDLLQADASSIDMDISSAAATLGQSTQVMEFSLSTWVYHKKLWMIEKVILLGFEQDIYLPDEYAGMYLFLSLIATRRKELLKRVEAHYLTISAEFLKSRRFREVQDVEEASPFLDSLLAETEGTASLALALARFYVICAYLGKLPMPRRTPFSTEKLRYELRMKPFLALQPPEAPPFDDFKAHSQPYGPVPSSSEAPPEAFVQDVVDKDSQLWHEVDDRIKAAKAAFAEYKRLGVGTAKAEGVKASWEDEVKRMVASCVSLGLAVKEIKDCVVGEGGIKEEEKGDLCGGFKMEIPEAGTGKRYAEGWIVGKVVKL